MKPVNNESRSRGIDYLWRYRHLIGFAVLATLTLLLSGCGDECQEVPLAPGGVALNCQVAPPPDSGFTGFGAVETLVPTVMAATPTLSYASGDVPGPTPDIAVPVEATPTMIEGGEIGIQEPMVDFAVKQVEGQNGSTDNGDDYNNYIIQRTGTGELIRVLVPKGTELDPDIVARLLGNPAIFSPVDISEIGKSVMNKVSPGGYPYEGN